MSTVRKTVLVLFSVLAALLAAAYMYGERYFQSHFLPGTAIEAFDVSMMDEQEAEALLKRKVNSYALEIDERGGGVEKLAASEIGLSFTGKEHLQKMMQNQDTKFWFIPASVSEEVTDDDTSLDEQKFQRAVYGLTCMTDFVQPKRSEITKSGDRYVVVSGTKGNRPDKAKTAEVIKTAVMQWDRSVDLEKAGCYEDIKQADEKELQKKCDILNKMTGAILTFDFADRKETLTSDYAERNFLTDYALDTKKIEKYVDWLGARYNTVGAEREFVTYDSRTITTSGGDYGWQIDTEKTAEKTKKLLEKGTVDVIEPAYKQRAVSRTENDIGYSYLEIEKKTGKTVLYVDGKPVVQTISLIGDGTGSGVFRVLSLSQDDMSLATKAAVFHGYDEADTEQSGEASGFSGIKIPNGTIMVPRKEQESIISSISADWPVVIY